MKSLYGIYKRMHFYTWQDADISRLIGEISEHDSLQEFEEGPSFDGGPFIITLYLLVSLCFNSDKGEVIKFLEYLLTDEHTREA